VVIAAFPGAQITKTRPAVVLSSRAYLRHHPDVVLGLINTQHPKTLTSADSEIREWRRAGLHGPSFFRLYLVTLLQRDVRVIGRLTDSDWAAVRECVRIGLGDE
jgi:mRNA-degrading endonuclease toxin of MazEF toxin-antitoxin module